MKKFLSILLALAVGFTFTFGSAMSAFAEPADNTKVTEATVMADTLSAANYAKAQEKTAMDKAIDALFGNETVKTFNGTNVSKASVTAVFTKVYEEATADIDKQYNEKLAAIQAAIIADNASGEQFSGYFTTGTAEDGYPQVDATWTVYNATTVYSDLFKSDGTGTKAKDVYSEEFTSLKNATITAIQAIDLTVYSTDAKGATESNYDKASRLVAQALNEITILQPADNANATAFINAIAKLYKIYTPGVNAAGPTGDLFAGTNVSGKSYAPGLDNIQKTTAEPTEAAKLQWAQDKVLGELTAAITSAKNSAIKTLNDAIIEENLKTKPNQTIIDKAKEDIATAEAQYAAALDVATYLVKDCDDYNELVTVDPTTFTKSLTDASKWSFTAGVSKFAGNNYTLAKCKDITDKIAELNADAELAKKSVELDGTTYAEIDKALKSATKKAYYGDLTVSIKKASDSELLKDRKADLIGKDDKSQVKVNNKTYDAVEAWDKALTSTYNKDKFDAVRKVMDDAKTAIKAAKTTADADAAFLAGIDALKAVPTKSDKTLAQAKKDFADLKTKYEKDIKAYADYKAASYPAKTYKYDANKFKANLVKEFLNAYTVDELTAIYNDDVAKVDALKTEAQLKEDKAAIEKQIAAIPTKVTVEDKASVEAARKALDEHNEYCDFIGNTTEKIVVVTPLVNAENAIKNAEIKAIEDAYDAIVKDNKVTLDEKAAIEALRTAFDNYCKAYTPENAAPAEVVTAAGKVTEASVATLEAQLYTKEADKVKEMIAVLDVNNIDAAAVKAAREAYDALNEDYQFGGSYYDKLVALEKTLAGNADENAKAYVQDLAIAVRTAKVGKKVKVTVKADVQTLIDNGYTVTYKFYKSTKKGSGYKNTVNKTTNTYTNTNPVKGKNYYKVKLVVKNADGAVVATTPLTQCKYGVRTIK